MLAVKPYIRENAVRYARKFAFEETYKTLVNKPNDILERLLFFKEEMEENSRSRSAKLRIFEKA